MATHITTLAELQNMSANLAEDYILDNDIDATASQTMNEIVGYPGTYNGFAPIGASGTPFTGSFDGGGHTIKNLYINRSTTQYVGLFGYIAPTASKTFKDVTLSNVNINGKCDVGAFAGYAVAATATNLVISNVHASGSVECGAVASNTGAGGLFGRLGGNVDDCTSSVSISHDTNVTNNMVLGGFAGNILSGTVDNSIATGAITVDCDGSNDTHTIGGFAGTLGGGSGVAITGCTASGNLVIDITTTATLYIGGFYGSAQTSTSTTATSFAYGDVRSNSVSTCYLGGFVGKTSQTLNKVGATGDVENAATTHYTGGFTGEHGGATLTNAYAKGTVCLEGITADATAQIGGFAGKTGSTGTLDYCYSIGQVYKPASYGGGFAGVNVGGAVSSGCFWDTETSGYGISAEGTGKTTAQMKTESTFTDASWDFDANWFMPTLLRAAGNGTIVWLSKTSDPENFEEDVKDADSFSLVVPTGDSIRWIEGLDSLLVGTAGSEWRIGTNNLDTPLTPTNYTVKQQTSHGSSTIQPVKVHDTLLFVDYVGRKLREISRSAEKYIATDLTALAEHITYSGIVGTALQKNPDVILWCWLDDGSLLSFTYDREQNVLAWAKHPIDGELLSVCVIPNAAAGEDEVWLSIGRTIDSIEKVYLERLASRVVLGAREAYFVDCGATTDHGAGFLVDRITRAPQAIVSTAEYVTYGGDSVYYEDELVTYETAHGFSNGEFVRITGLTQPSELNDTVYYVSDATTYTFKIKDTAATAYIDTSDYSDFAGLGTVEQVACTFSGLDHLNGETVTILGDGVPYGTAVVAGGSVTLSEYYNTVQIGLAFTAKVQPMRLVLNGPRGSSMGSITKVNELVLSLMDSRNVKYGNDDDNLYDVNLDSVNLENGSEIDDLFTGDVPVALDGGFSLQNPIIVASDDPTPLNLRSIVARIDQTGR